MSLKFVEWIPSGEALGLISGMTMVIIWPRLMDRRIKLKKKAKTKPGFLSVRELKGAYWSAATMPKIRKQDASGMPRNAEV